MPEKNKGGRPPNPTPKWNPEKLRWEVRVTLPGNKRSLRAIPELGPHDEARAQRVAKLMVERAKVLGVVPDDVGLTCNEWVEDWYTYLANRKKMGTVPERRSRMKRVLEVIGATPIASVTREQIEDVRDMLDEQIEIRDAAYESVPQADDEGEERKGLLPGLSWKTAFHTWSDLRCMFSDARDSKDRALHARKDDPTAGVKPPEKGATKAKAVLYSDEATTLLACGDVPVKYRALYAVAIYTGMRAGELEALRWTDVDLVHGFISVTKAVNRKSGKVGPTKTEETGDVPIEPALAPLLAAMKEGRPESGHVLWLPPDEDRAENLRKHLRKAGITRAALYANDARSKRIWFHDLRATSLTWRAIRGDEAAVIQAVARHTSFATTLGYINGGATLLRKRVASVFDPLPPELIERGGEVSASVSAFEARTEALSPMISATPMGIEDPSETTADRDDRAAIPGEVEDDDSEPTPTSRPLGSGSVSARELGACRFDASVTNPTDGEIECAIVRAMLDGRGALAEELASMLRSRRASASNVVLPFARRFGR